jgi:beta-1,4-mannosyltransferase
VEKVPDRTDTSKLKVAFLPIWGKLNETIPVMQMRALNSMGIAAGYGSKGTFFTAIRTYFRFKPTIIHFDWIHQYTLAPDLPKSLLKTAAFVIDIWLAKRVFGVKIIWTLHNMQHHEQRPRKLEKWVQGWFAKQCLKVRLLGKGIEKQVMNHLRISSDKIEVLPEGSFVDWYPETVSNQAEAREILKLNPQEKVWLFFGNLRPYKGVENLIEYFKNAGFSNTKLIIAGSAYRQDYAKSLVKMAGGNPHIRMETRQIPDEEIAIFFHAADLVVLPFKEVLNSSTVNLAMSFGKPVVAAAKGLVPFRLNKQPELLFGKHKTLAEALDMAAILEKETLESIGLQNLEEVEQYTWNDFAIFMSGMLHG